MAFTLAHMAAALPFYRNQRWLCFDALLIGTMLPDLPYFLSTNPNVGQLSHQWQGIFSYCLPWGLLVFILWHWVLKLPAIMLIQPWRMVTHAQYTGTHQATPQHPFGAWFAAKLKQYGIFWLTVIFGLTFGTITHLLWDGITHPDGFIAKQVGWLQYLIHIPILGTMPVARFLQYASSIVGLMLLVMFSYRYLKHQVVTSNSLNNSKPLLTQGRSMLIGVVIIMSSISMGTYAAFKWSTILWLDHYLFLAKILVGALQGAIVAFAVYALLYRCMCWFKHGLPRQ